MDGDPQMNPYSAPAVAEVSNDKNLPYYRSGEFLYVRDGAELPKRCVHTNLDVPEGGWRKRKLYTWTPQWIIVLIPFGLLPYLLLAVVLQKKAKITYSLNPGAKERLSRKRGTALGVMVLGIVIAVAGTSYLEGDWWGIALLAGIIVALIGLIACAAFNPVTVKGERNGWFKLKGCSPDFLDSLPTGIGG